MRVYDDLAILVPEVYLPKPSVDHHKWAVIAVDQFTSEPEYWEQVEEIVGDEPSTFQMTLPEIFLDQPDVADRIRNVRNTMRQYLRAGLMQSREGVILVERTACGKTRRGLMLCLDLERYDYAEGSSSLIRATEGTIVERLPPRMKIREGAALELPHILVLIDDPRQTVIEPLIAIRKSLRKLYDFGLMLGSGHVAGYAIADEAPVIAALRALATPEAFAARYGVGSEAPVMLFAVGDGNHSLATAKAVWEKIKPSVEMNHPARYAMVEVANIHDQGLTFEPIHRVLYELKLDFLSALRERFGDKLKYTGFFTAGEMVERLHGSGQHAPCIGVIGGESPFGIAEIANPVSSLPLGTIQPFLDKFMNDGGAVKIDYVHGEDAVVRLGSQPGNLGIFLPGIDKADLFKSVIRDGTLPRKTFSMGAARSKRFYLEARKIF